MFSSTGSLKDPRDRFASVEFQHEISEWGIREKRRFEGSKPLEKIDAEKTQDLTRYIGPECIPGRQEPSAPGDDKGLLDKTSSI